MELLYSYILSKLNTRSTSFCIHCTCTTLTLPPSQVTGVRGLMARSVLHENSTVPVPAGEWHRSTSIPGWLWKGDTSSDEVAGHMFAYPLVHDLVARNEEERAAASGLVDDIVGE